MQHPHRRQPESVVARVAAREPANESCSGQGKENAEMEKSRLWTRSPGYAALSATAASASAAATPSTSRISRFILPPCRTFAAETIYATCADLANLRRKDERGSVGRVDRIAAAAQANKRLIYDFSDKNGLFDAVVDTYIDHHRRANIRSRAASQRKG
jgi:hypothetical protein